MEIRRSGVEKRTPSRRRKNRGSSNPLPSIFNQAVDGVIQIINQPRVLEVTVAVILKTVFTDADFFVVSD